MPDCASMAESVLQRQFNVGTTPKYEPKADHNGLGRMAAIFRIVVLTALLLVLAAQGWVVHSHAQLESRSELSGSSGGNRPTPASGLVAPCPICALQAQAGQALPVGGATISLVSLAKHGLRCDSFAARETIRDCTNSPRAPPPSA